MTKLRKANKDTVLAENERLVLVATVHTDLAASKKRFAEALAGRGRPVPVADCIPLYALVKTDCATTTGLTPGEKKVCDDIVDDFMEIFLKLEKKEMTQR